MGKKTFRTQNRDNNEAKKSETQTHNQKVKQVKAVEFFTQKNIHRIDKMGWNMKRNEKHEKYVLRPIATERNSKKE